MIEDKVYIKIYIHIYIYNRDLASIYRTFLVEFGNFQSKKISMKIMCKKHKIMCIYHNFIL